LERPLSLTSITPRIVTVRGQRVVIDADLLRSTE
jgi:hypothetical protein